MVKPLLARPIVPFSATRVGVSLSQLVDYTRAHDARFVLIRPDTQLMATLKAYDLRWTSWARTTSSQPWERPSPRTARRRHRMRRGGNPHLADADPAA